MRSLPILVSRTLGLLVAAAVSLPIPVGAQDPLQGYDLITALQQGGYVIYFRHAITDVSQTDQSDVDYTDWTTQRNLSEEGRVQARDIGNAMRALGIPVSEVITSPFCRCIETAWLAFGKGVVNPDLAFAIGTTEAEANHLGKALRRMLGTPPPAGANTVLISHTANLKEAANIWPKPEGIVLVFKPEAKGDFAFVGMIKPEQWGGFVVTAGGDTSRDAEQVSDSVERSVVCGAQVHKRADSGHATLK
jgi:phosphohistidine phosphatase SixA